MRYKIAYIIFAVFFLSGIKAQDHGFFNQVWLEEGLSQSSISSIVQDKKGLMWLGTQDGLNRYDGRLIDQYNFKPFDSKSIAGDDITGFCMRDNTLYIITAAGLDMMDVNSQTVTHCRESIKENEKPSTLLRIWNINGEIFLFTSRGFCKLSLNNNSFSIQPLSFGEKDKNDFRLFVSSLCSGKNGELYAATNKGIFHAPSPDKEFLPLLDMSSIVKTETGTPLECNTILFSNNKIYFSVSQNYYCYNLQSKQTIGLTIPGISPSTINNSLIDNHNHIWLGTNGGGLFRLAVHSDSLVLDKSFYKNLNNRFGLKSNDISCLYQNPDDPNDMVWIGTRDAGVFSYSYSKNSFQLASSLLNSNEPNYFGIVKDKDGIIWSGFNYGILKLDRKNKSFYNINLSSQLSKLQRFIEAIYCDDDNNIWTGFANGLYKIDKKNNTLITVIEPLFPGKRNHVFRILKYSRNEILLCCTQGIVIYNTLNSAIEYRSEALVDGEKRKIEASNSFFIDSKNNWWIGSSKGLFYINSASGKAKFFTHDVNDTNSLVTNRIMDVNETREGNIIVASSKGLSLLSNPDGKTTFTNFHNAKGLSNNFIYGLLRDENGNFWMSTNFGISVFDPVKKEFKSYSASDGVCINEFNSAGFHKSFDGEFLFGGIGGLVSIYPEKQVINKNVPDVFLKSLKIENYDDSISSIAGSTLLLKHNQNKINFEFIAPDFSGANNINLFYRFSPGGKWTKINPSKVFSLSFAKLAPGNYNLEIIAQNSEGIQSKPLTYSFVISPPYWLTWWFFVLIILAVIFASWGIYRIRLHNKIEHIKEVERVRKEENEKVRKAAALDLHDEFGNGLTRISMLIEMARIHIPKENKEANNLLDVISQNSQRLYQGTKDFIWSINPGNDNLYEIIIRIKDFGDELFYGTGCTFEVSGLKEEFRNIKQMPSSGRNIAMIFKEALSNIVKHSKASHVNLSIEPNGVAIAVKLKDNGIGFENKGSKNSFGLANMQQRAGRAGATIDIQSEKTKGTEIILTIKKPENNFADENSIN